MPVRLAIDAYGRFRVHTEPGADGAWTLWRTGVAAKRTRLSDVIVPPGVPARAIVDAPEATFHEMARPGERIRVTVEA